MSPGRRAAISAFVVFWNLAFHYESLRLNFLGRALGAELPKIRFLFPPAGWIMFYRVVEADGGAQVYGIRAGKAEPIDPHRIFQTRWVGYDNIRRNVLVTVLHPAYGPDFCRYLQRKFPEFDGFAIVEVWTPAVVREPEKRLYRPAYKC